MLMKSVLATILAIASLLSCTKQYDVTLSDLLDEMTDRYSCCEYPEIPFKSMMTSSHDRRSVNPSDDTWYANDDGFGYEYLDQSNGRQEKVLLEQEGPGVITRIWITTRNPKSTLRFYFDGHAEPDWVVNSFDFTEFGLKALEDNPLVCKHTSYEKGIKGGQTFLLPLPYASGCKVTLEEPEGWSGVPRYYHFEYRKYPENVTVETFSVDVASRMSDKIRVSSPADTVSVQGSKEAAGVSITTIKRRSACTAPVADESTRPPLSIVIVTEAAVHSPRTESGAEC